MFINSSDDDFWRLSCNKKSFSAVTLTWTWTTLSHELEVKNKRQIKKTILWFTMSGWLNLTSKANLAVISSEAIGKRVAANAKFSINSLFITHNICHCFDVHRWISMLKSIRMNFTDHRNIFKYSETSFLTFFVGSRRIFFNILKKSQSLADLFS